MELSQLDGVATTADAIMSLHPTAKWSFSEGVVTWNSGDITEPTALALSNEVTRLQAAYDALDYSRLRKAKYDLLNQDEMRYDDVKNSTTTWVDAIDAIKAAHPKP